MTLICIIHHTCVHMHAHTHMQTSDFIQDFRFQHEMQMVAVYFHEDFYSGEVV